MYTLMQISDLHRASAGALSNDELLSGLTADNERYKKEHPPIPSVDAIIITGDLVQGLPLGSVDYPSELERQYAEAYEFIAKLADAFVQGDHSRVVIVPGNHDIDYQIALQSMTPLPKARKNVRQLLELPDSLYRWSWDDLQLFKIDNLDMYDDRLKFFCRLYDQFYKDSKLATKPDAKQSFNQFELDQGKILVTAYDSCTKVDCFNSNAEIQPQAIAQSHLDCLKNYLLKIAVWHHDVQGPARRSDYVDLDSVQLMIDKGYRLGLHGHWHKSEAVPYTLHTFEDDTMVVISAGSLCAPPSQLPEGLKRQYNIIQILDSYCEAKIHIREMAIPGIFAPGRLISRGNRSYADVQWKNPPPSPFLNLGSGGTNIKLVDKIEQLVMFRSYDEAIRLIEDNRSNLGHYGRQLLSKVLFIAKRWEPLISLLSDPANPDELSKLMIARIELKQWKEYERDLEKAEKSGQFPHGLITACREKLNAEKRI